MQKSSCTQTTLQGKHLPESRGLSQQSATLQSLSLLHPAHLCDTCRPVVNKRKKRSSAQPRTKSQRSKGNKQPKLCLGCLPPEEAARMLEEQASGIQHLQDNLAAVQQRTAEFEAAMVLMRRNTMRQRWWSFRLKWLGWRQPRRLGMHSWNQ